MARFHREYTSIDALRSALIEADLDDLDSDDIDEIIARYWDDFKVLAVRWLDAKWNDGGDVYQAVVDRGWFEDEWDKER